MTQNNSVATTNQSWFLKRAIINTMVEDKVPHFAPSRGNFSVGYVLRSSGGSGSLKD
jgi:hypothetical protein